MSSPTINALGAPLAVALEDMGEQAIVERWPPDGPTVDVWFKCYWRDRYTVVKYLRGGAIRSGTKTSYLRPSSYPDSPNLLCTAINEIRGRKPRTYQAGAVLPGWVTYEFAYVHAHFSVPTWDAVSYPTQDPSGRPMTTTRYKLSAEIFTPPTGAYFYTSGTYNTKQVAESSVGVVRSRAEISMTLHMIAYPYLALIMDTQGAVNDEPVTLADMTFPRGCLLFTGGDMEPISDPADGSRRWDYNLSLLGNQNIEWNEFMDPSGNYVLINDKSDGSGTPPFEYLSFESIFG